MEDFPLYRFEDCHVMLYHLREQFPDGSDEFDTFDDALWLLEEACLVQHSVDLERPEDLQRAVESILDDE